MAEPINWRREIRAIFGTIRQSAPTLNFDDLLAIGLFDTAAQFLDAIAEPYPIDDIEMLCYERSQLAGAIETLFAQCNVSEPDGRAIRAWEIHGLGGEDSDEGT